MFISAIVAMSENRVIGRDNQLPWHLPADMRHFKSLTMNNPILMGRKTFQSIGRALPGRCNIVISRDPHFQACGCVVANSVETALEAIDYSNEAFVIGGALLFEQMMPRIKRIYLTIIHHHFDGDTFFPELDPKEWFEVSREDHDADSENLHPYSFITLERK